MASPPRVTLGIATYNRDTFLAAAIRSALEQDFEDLEVLVVVDGATNPRIDDVLASFDREPRLRVVRHATNLGIAAAYNTFITAGHGELIAMIGDDDLCLPGRIRRQVEMFDRHPNTGVVHGDAIVIDQAGRQTGVWNSADFTPAALLHAFVFSHNHLVDPTRMVHRRVHEAVGGYDPRYPLANDMDFWMRACPSFRFRHCPGGPLSAIRRHGENTSDGRAGRSAEIADVEGILEEAFERHSLREIVPGLDWAVLDPADAESQALGRIADGLERRLLPLPGLAARVRQRAARRSAAVRRPTGRAAPKGKLMITASGVNDAGGETTVPRLAAKALTRRGWQVTVFQLAAEPTRARLPYEQRERVEDGVRMITIHNRPAGLLDPGHPDRELDDSPTTDAFAAALDRLTPDVVHFHDLHHLGAGLIDRAAVRGIPSHLTTYDCWLACPRCDLMTEAGAICPGPGHSALCATCTGESDPGESDPSGHQVRLAGIRAHVHAGASSVLCASHTMRRTLLEAGYDPEVLDVVRQATPQQADIWDQVGRDRPPGRRGEQLTVAVLGFGRHPSPQLVVEAAQRTVAELAVKILGEVPAPFVEPLQALDRRGVVELCGAFAPSEIGGLLSDVDIAVLPSMWRDGALLAAAECLAARTPLVVPRLAGLPDGAPDGIDGIAFDGLDSGSLASALDRVASKPGLLESLQRAIEPPRTFSDYIDDLERYYAGERPGRIEGSLRDEDAAVRCEPFAFERDHGLRVLATPAWRGADRLGELLHEWGQATGRTTDACLYLLADPATAGDGSEIERRVRRAAELAGADLEACADIEVLIEPMSADRDERLHQSVNAYVPLHPACSGHVRLAASAGTAVLDLGTGQIREATTKADATARAA